MTRAGALAAEWCVTTMPALKRRTIAALPRSLRARFALRTAAAIMAEIYSASRATTRVRKGVARVEVRDSLFCHVREPQTLPLCGFYTAIVTRTLALLDVGVTGAVRVERCRAVDADGRACTMTVALSGGPAAVASAGAAAAVVALLVLPSSASAQDRPGTRILVAPFAVDAHAAAPAGGATLWLGDAATILLADEFHALGFGAMTRDERVAAFERLKLPRAATLTRATLIRVGDVVGATEFVTGEIQLGETLTVRARVVRLASGQGLPDVIEEAPPAQLFELFQRLARRLGSQMGLPLFETAAARSHPPLAAFESYVKGLVAATPAAQQRFLDAALKAAPRDDRVLIALWSVYSSQGAHDKALASARQVAADSPLARRARFDAALSLVELSRFDEAFKSLEALYAERASAVVSNAQGLVQVRRGAAAVFYFNRAVQEDPENAHYRFNLGYAYALARDPVAAIYWLRDTVRHQPADSDAHLVLSAVLAATGKTAEAQREFDLAALLGTRTASRPAAISDKVPSRLERLPTDLDAPPTPHDAASENEKAEMASFHLDRGRRLFDQGDDRSAVDELRRATYLSPYDDEPHLWLGRLYARGGRVTEAIDEFKIANWCRETVAARVALGAAYLTAGDRVAARGEADRALVLDPNAQDAKDLLKKIGGMLTSISR
jgi:Tfp pilus assembly protein PilF